jgi:hypothetical protein
MNHSDEEMLRPEGETYSSVALGGFRKVQLSLILAMVSANDEKTRMALRTLLSWFRGGQRDTLPITVASRSEA